MAFELVSNCCSNEICPVGVKTVPHHQVDVAEIHVAEIDRDLFGVARLGPQLMHIFRHFSPSIEHLYGWYMDGDKVGVKGYGECRTLTAVWPSSLDTMRN